MKEGEVILEFGLDLIRAASFEEGGVVLAGAFEASGFEMAAIEMY